MDKLNVEVKALQELLMKEFDLESPLVLQTHKLLCETYKNEFVKLGQYDNIIVEGVEYGHCGLKSFIQINNKRYELWIKTRTILRDLSYDYP